MSHTTKAKLQQATAPNRDAVPLMTARYALRLQAVAPRGQLQRNDHMLARLAGPHLNWSKDALAALQDARFVERTLSDAGERPIGRLPKPGQGISHKKIAKLLAELRDWDDAQFRQLVSDSECAITARLHADLSASVARIGGLHALLDLNEDELALLYSLTCRCLSPLLDEMMEFETSCFRTSLRTYARVLGIKSSSLRALLSRDSRLIKYDLVTVDPTEKTLRSQIAVGSALTGWVTGLDSTLGGKLGHTFEPLPAGRYGSAEFLHVQTEWAVIAAALSGALKESASGVNILLYADPGDGKTEFVKGMLSALALQGYLIGYPTDRELPAGGVDRLVALQTTLELMAHRKNAVLVMDHADEVLECLPSATHSGARETERSGCSRQWVLTLLERNTLPVIWLCNEEPEIDGGYLRRFQVLLRLPPLAPPQLPVSRVLPSSDALLKAKYEGSDHGQADIDSAQRFAAVCRAGGHADTDQVVRMLLAQAHRRRGRMSAQRSCSRPRSYSPTLLNLSTHVPLPDMIAALARKKHGSMIFYGLPGTGKTALVEYIADQIGMRLTRVCASNLLGQYVGETERNIASMFQQAEADETILFLDEADSFFRNRSNAERAWEVSQVNEMLQRMERHSGIFICATNLIQDLDPAVLRRFSFKIEFRALSASQRESLFISEALEGDSEALSSELLAGLQSLDGLTPGDFHVVRQQVDLLDEHPSPEHWLTRLSAELRAKNQGKRTIGFGM